MIKATLTAAEAAKIMRECGIPKDTLTLCAGIEEGIYDFGSCTHMSQRCFEISKKKFAKYIEDFCGLKIT